MNFKGRALLYFALALIALAPLSLQAELRCEIVHQVQSANEILATNNFKANRGLQDYANNFNFENSPSFQQTLAHLPKGALWVDMGAGEAKALIEGLQKYPQISKGIAIAYKRPDRFSKPADLSMKRFEYIEGDYVENMEREGRLGHFNSRIDLITDVYGPFSYSEDLVSVMQTYLNLLKVDGVLLFNFMSARNFDPNIFRNSPPQDQMNIINEVDSQPANLIRWLRTIPGIEVQENHRELTFLGYKENSFSVKIRKLKDNIVVPQSLRLLMYKPGSPPTRSFHVE